MTVAPAPAAGGEGGNDDSYPTVDERRARQYHPCRAPKADVAMSPTLARLRRTLGQRGIGAGEEVTHRAPERREETTRPPPRPPSPCRTYCLLLLLREAFLFLRSPWAGKGENVSARRARENETAAAVAPVCACVC